MLPRPNRLRRRSDVTRVRREGRQWRHPLAVLLVCPALEPMDQSVGSSPPKTRFAFIASRRVGNAVSRNRAKRLLREAVRASLPDVKPGWDCLFISRQGADSAPFGEVEKAVHILLTRAQLMAERIDG